MLRNLNEFSLPALEEKVLAYWRANRVFEASLALRRAQGKRARKRFVFYEGPPTANGRPGIHHVLARAFKDIMLRYKTMRGFYVPRRGGWDTHGLPVEIEVEKALGLTSKKDIEKFGIAAFNAKCKESVWKYKDEWERLTERMGFWLDMQHPYITYENRYMEAVWGILKKVWEKKLLYRGHKVVPWCPRCGTGLSSHELALGYETVEDTSVYLKFKLKPGQKIGKYNIKHNFYILSWTTTPWTLPGNVALAVGKDIEYDLFETAGRSEVHIVAKKRAKSLGFSDAMKSVKGSELIGLSYEPLFDIPSLKGKASYKVYPANFVTTEDGTGVVHTAVMYGEDDYQLGAKVGLPARHTVNEAGKFTADVKGFEGLYVKAPETEKKIFEHLEKKGLLLKTEKYSHEYPFCWRCKTPLLYYARDSWFIAMSRLRAKLLSENSKIKWVPTHLRDGRFGEWLREVKDWAISRSRYWGTPLPIWQCEKCEHTEVLGSMEELAARAEARNAFIFVRHGEADHNVLGVCATHEDLRDFTAHLTKKGETVVRRTAKALKMKLKEADYIMTSPLARTKETAAILQETLGGKVVIEPDLRDMNAGAFTLKPLEDFYTLFKDSRERFGKNPHGGETLNDVRARIGKVFTKINSRYEGKTIVVVSHGDPLWMFKGVMEGASDDEQLSLPYPRTGERYDVRTDTLPRDESGRVDLHRPYVDDVVFPCAKCKKGTMKRVPEVLDCWFDSGAMPFSCSEKSEYPADYISEGVDQTRGWFYTLLAIGVLMGKGRSYKNVISLGLVLDKNGQKMSKSKGNVVDPWAMAEKYGVDAVRWYFYTVNPPGEPKKFDEEDLTKTLRQFLMMVYNSWLFYETYADKTANGKWQITNNKNVLDQWVVARLEETKNIATKSLEKYEVGDAARAIEAFAGDLSRWYIRRSRRRFQPARVASQSAAGGKPENDKDYRAASETLGYVLSELSKLLAPFTPFFAEALHLSLLPNKKGVVNSVHLETWPKAAKANAASKKLVKEMDEVRRFASMGLAVRTIQGIKVRQPLNQMEIKSGRWGNKELLSILADEVNVKKVVPNPKLTKGELLLDVTITHELQEEGWFRELVRTVQRMRQDAKLAPKDTIVVYAEVPPELAHVIRTREKEFVREVNAKSVEFALARDASQSAAGGRAHKHNVELSTKVDVWPVWLAVKKLS